MRSRALRADLLMLPPPSYGAPPCMPSAWAWWWHSSTPSPAPS